MRKKIENISINMPRIQYIPKHIQKLMSKLKKKIWLEMKMGEARELEGTNLSDGLDTERGWIRTTIIVRDYIEKNRK
jgi:hypothetical protein